MIRGSEITKINDTLLQNACWYKSACFANTKVLAQHSTKVRILTYAWQADVRDCHDSGVCMRTYAGVC
jgi:hypothetical protein